MPKASSATASGAVELDAAEILRLQHSVGNHAMVRLLHALRGGSADEPGGRRGEIQEETGCSTAVDDAPSCEGRMSAPAGGRNGVLRNGAQRPSTRGAGLAFLRRVSAEVRRAGDGRSADAIEEAVRVLSLCGGSDNRSGSGLPLLREAVGLWARDTRRWGRPPWWVRARAWFLWLLSLGRRGAPWLTTAVPTLARVPGWRRRDAAFVAEVVYRATGRVLRHRVCRSQAGHWWPFRERSWTRPEVAIEGFVVVNTPGPGDVWSDGRRAGVVLSKDGGRALVVLPGRRSGEGSSSNAGLALLSSERGGVVRRLAARV